MITWTKSFVSWAGLGILTLITAFLIYYSFTPTSWWGEVAAVTDITADKKGTSKIVEEMGFWHSIDFTSPWTWLVLIGLAIPIYGTYKNPHSKGAKYASSFIGFIAFCVFLFVLFMFSLYGKNAPAQIGKTQVSVTTYIDSVSSDTPAAGAAELPIRGEKLIAGKKYTLREKTWLALPIPSDRCIALQPSAGFEEKRVGDNYLLRSYGGNIEVKAFVLKDGETLGSYTCT